MKFSQWIFDGFTDLFGSWRYFCARISFESVDKLINCKSLYIYIYIYERADFVLLWMARKNIEFFLNKYLSEQEKLLFLHFFAIEVWCGNKNFCTVSKNDYLFYNHLKNIALKSMEISAYQLEWVIAEDHWGRTDNQWENMFEKTKRSSAKIIIVNLILILIPIFIVIFMLILILSLILILVFILIPLLMLNSLWQGSVELYHNLYSGLTLLTSCIIFQKMLLDFKKFCALAKKEHKKDRYNWLPTGIFRFLLHKYKFPKRLVLMFLFLFLLFIILIFFIVASLR